MSLLIMSPGCGSGDLIPSALRNVTYVVSSFPIFVTSVSRDQIEAVAIRRGHRKRLDGELAGRAHVVHHLPVQPLQHSLREAQLHASVRACIELVHRGEAGRAQETVGFWS